uniref:Secreted protein n=1 Tax=Echinostoma caproni TaxID=27848 RepID=A0A183BDI7_9TREM
LIWIPYKVVSVWMWTSVPDRNYVSSVLVWVAYVPIDRETTPVSVTQAIPVLTVTLHVHVAFGHLEIAREISPLNANHVLVLARLACTRFNLAVPGQTGFVKLVVHCAFPRNSNSHLAKPRAIASVNVSLAWVKHSILLLYSRTQLFITDHYSLCPMPSLIHQTCLNHHR